MKKIYVLVLALSITTISFSQSISIGAIGGATMFQSPKEFTNSISNGGFGFKNSANFGIKGKFDFPLLPLSTNLSIMYIPLSSEEYSIKVNSNILALGIGAEWSFLPGPVSPYAGLDILFNSFGDLEAKTPFGNMTEKGFTRDGFAIGAGVVFGLLPLFDVDVSAKYVVYNFLGKKGNENSVSSINISAGIYYNFL